MGGNNAANEAQGTDRHAPRTGSLRESFQQKTGPTTEQAAFVTLYQLRTSSNLSQALVAGPLPWPGSAAQVVTRGATVGTADASRLHTLITVHGWPPENNVQRHWQERKIGPCVLVFFHVILLTLGFTLVYPWITPRSLQILFYGITSAVGALSLLLLLLVNQCDPGVIPPRSSWDPQVVAAERGLPTPLKKDEKGQWVRRRLGGRSDDLERYCWTCKLWRDARTTHCNKCGFCMERFDHHCGVVGTCVARKNHRFFVGFLLAAGSGAGLLVAGSVVVLAQKHWAGGDAWGDWETYFALVLGFLFVYTSLIMIFGCIHFVLLICSKHLSSFRGLLSECSYFHSQGGPLQIAMQPMIVCHGISADLTTKQWVKAKTGGPKVYVPTLREFCWNLGHVCCAPISWKYTQGLLGSPRPVAVVPEISSNHVTSQVGPPHTKLDFASMAAKTVEAESNGAA